MKLFSWWSNNENAIFDIVQQWLDERGLRLQFYFILKCY